MKIHTIYATPEQAVSHWTDGLYAGEPVVTDISDLPTEAQTAWTASIHWMVQNALAEGDSLNGHLIIDYKRNAAIADAEEEEIDGELVTVITARRHVALASVPVRRADGRTRQVPVSSEDMPEALRDALLMIIAARESAINSE
ncbi:MAG: hypothetical protein AAF571_07035 [Verrucomicrobiota bacterium]